MAPDDRPFEVARLDGINVLVVDDNADARTIFKHLLAYAGASVLVAASATAAVRTLRHVHPDVVLSDLSMPRRDGLWLLGWVRKREACRGDHLPVIAVTARDDLYHEGAPEVQGFDAYLRKPVPSRQLYAIIAKLVRESAERRPDVSASG
jgi:CheY-like chemotaxis protein